MKTVLLAAGAVALALTAGQALAHGKTKHHKGGMAAAASPKQPIPYAQLDAYLKASPSQRAKKDWWAGQPALASNTSASSAGANAAATTPSPSPSTTSPSSPSDTSSSTTSPTPSAPSSATSPTAPPPTDTPSPPAPNATRNDNATTPPK